MGNLSRSALVRAAYRMIGGDSGLRDAAILQTAYSQGEWNREAACWAEITEALSKDPVIADAIKNRRRTPIPDVSALKLLPEGTLGWVFADHVEKSGIKLGTPAPMPIDRDSDFLFVHFIETHDIWHAVTGYGVDYLGEVSITGFTAAQFGNAPHFAMLIGIYFLNTAFTTPTTFVPRMEALIDGWQVGRKARSLIGVDWSEHWDKPVVEVRRMFDIPESPNLAGLGLSEMPAGMAR